MNSPARSGYREGAKCVELRTLVHECSRFVTIRSCRAAVVAGALSFLALMVLALDASDQRA
jgi:hypothetical protein